jgi:hypothetical protein
MNYLVDHEINIKKPLQHTEKAFIILTFLLKFARNWTINL